nr:MAG TPA: hypothetical protein [Caudoviricetes sp.]
MRSTSATGNKQITKKELILYLFCSMVMVTTSLYLMF